MEFSGKIFVCLSDSGTVVDCGKLVVCVAVGINACASDFEFDKSDSSIPGAI